MAFAMLLGHSLGLHRPGPGVWSSLQASSPSGKHPADDPSSGLLLRNSISVTILGKPYYVLYILGMVT